MGPREEYTMNMHGYTGRQGKFWTIARPGQWDKRSVREILSGSAFSSLKRPYLTKEDVQSPELLYINGSSQANAKARAHPSGCRVGGNGPARTRSHFHHGFDFLLVPSLHLLSHLLLSFLLVLPLDAMRVTYATVR